MEHHVVALRTILLNNTEKFPYLVLLPIIPMQTILVRQIFILIDNIKTRLGKWGTAWIIGGFPEKFKRERLAKDTGAELIYCPVSRED
ncbi:hypothetical protein [Paenibacillus sp. IHBB 3054]|uniref:hypothetical protein n=1 Tax=Paenibacillus sp. IHBB 3054 TaxID=3425689 RepID=UPI003F671E6B